MPPARDISRPAMTPLLDFGPQPICNRFPATREEDEALFPLALAVESERGLVRLATPPPVRELCPRVDWIRYNEPEGHLDAAVEWVIAETGLSKAARLVGVSYKDGSTVERFRRLGFANGAVLDLAGDLGIESPCAGIETIQERITPETAARIVAARGRCDVLIVRHVVEHAHRLDAFFAGVAGLLNPGGVAVFEMPDFSTSLRLREYSNVWEEHASYFTPDTFPRIAARHGGRVVAQRCYPYPMEDSLVSMVAFPGGAVPAGGAPGGEEMERALGYGAAFSPAQTAVRRSLEKLAGTGPIAVFGAGHLTAKFINFMRVADLCAFVADDHPQKCGRFMPGSRLPILPSAALPERGVKWCLSGLSPESEEKVMKNLGAFFAQSGELFSIFRASPRALAI
jgi:C-methyltransferase C-terminal domain/Methyltransferase domain